MKEFPYIPEEVFAQKLIEYVRGSTVVLGEGKSEAPITDHWTYHNEEKNMSGRQCLVHHGLFDKIFRRTVIMPTGWGNFRRQYLAPLADLLKRMYDECQIQGTSAWTEKSQERNDFPMGQDFWTRKTQEANYAVILDQLERRGIVRRKASRRYNDDAKAVSVLVNDKWVDVPGTFRTLQLVVWEMDHGKKYSQDIPHIEGGLYGDSVPCIFMVGSTISGSETDKVETQLDTLIKESSHHCPKRQKIAYVFAEKKKDGKYTPRYYGMMDVFMLEFCYGSPSGAILLDRCCLVPQPDMTENEEKSVDCDHFNWKGIREGILKNIPELQKVML